MPDILDALSKFSPFSSGENKPAEVPVLAPNPTVLETLRVEAEPTPAEKLAADLSMIDAVNQNPDALALLTVARERGNQLGADNQILNDWETLSPVEFRGKYGTDIYQKVAAFRIGGQHVGRLAATNRSADQEVVDAAIGVGSGAIQGAGGLISGIHQMLPGPINEFIATRTAELMGEAKEFTNSLQSDELNRLRYVDSLRSELDTMDNQEQFDVDKQQDGELLATLKSFGRDVVDGAQRLGENPAMLGDFTAEGVGSLLVGGPASKTLSTGARAANSALSRAARGGTPLIDDALDVGSRTVQRAIDQASFPITIGAMEAGSVYNQSVQEVLAMPLEELELQSPEYNDMVASGIKPEEARRTLAHRQGQIAAALTAPVSALAGRLVAPFEKAPFSRVSQLPGNAAREFTEEAIQSGTGELAGNIGKRVSGVESENNLGEGVGSATIQGGLAGAGTAAAIQTPGLALQQSARAAGASLRYGGRKLNERVQRVTEDIEQQSPVSREAVAAAVSTAAETAPAVAEGLQKLAQENNVNGEEIERFIARVEEAATTKQEDLQDLPLHLTEQVLAYGQEQNRLPNRFETLALMAQIAGDEQAPQADRISAGIFIINQLENQKKLFQEDYPKFLDNVPHNRPEFKQFQDYAGIFQVIQQTPEIHKALRWAVDDMAMPEQDLSEIDLNSEQGRQIVNNTIGIATHTPQNLNAGVAEQILQQADKGTVALSPEQRRIIEGAASLLKSGRVYEARTRLVEPQQQEIAEVDQSRETGTEFVARQIETQGGSKAHQTSLRDHVAGINLDVANGDMQGAREKVQRLGRFGRSMRNKVEAFNTAIKNGDRKKVAYQSLGANGNWLPKDDYFQVFFNPGSEASEKLARQVHAEAVATITLANDFAKRYPEFGISEIAIPALNLPEFNAQNIENVSYQDENINNDSGVKNSVKRGSSTVTQDDSRTQVTDTGSPDSSQQLELPLSSSQPIQTKPSEESDSSTGADPVGDEAEPVVEATAGETAAAETTGSPETAVGAGRETVSGVQENISENPIVFFEDDIEDNTGTTDPVLTLEEVYPSLVQPQGGNWFHKAFGLPGQATSRLGQLINPLSEIGNMIGTTDLAYEVTAEDRANLQELLVGGNQVLAHLKHRLRDVVTARKNGKPSLLERLADGDGSVLRMRDNRALNILERTDKGFRYNPQLIESAVLAGLDWALNAQSRAARVTRAQAANILAIDEASVTETHLEALNRGLSLSDAKRSLAETIRKFWGVETNNSTPEAYTRGIPEGLAAEILHGLENSGFIEIGEPELTGVTRTIKRVWFDTRNKEIKELMQSLHPVARIIGDLALVEPEKTGFNIGEPIDTLPATQLHNPLVSLTGQQKQAISNLQKAAYYPNLPMFDLIQALGEDNFVTLMGGRLFEEDKLNVNHRRSVEGKNRTLSGAYQAMARQMAQVKAWAAKRPNVALKDVPTYYEYQVTRVGRLQMMGLANPQADKLAREIFMPTRSVLDLSDTAGGDFNLFAMTIGQGIGIKTEKKTRSNVVEQVVARTLSQDGDLRPLVLDLKNWLQERENGRGKSLSENTVNLLNQAGLSLHGLHGLVEMARYERARDRGADLSRFETSNYLEADGKTNGPINALMLLPTGEFSSDWLRLVGKGGVYPGKTGQTLNAWPDKADLYQEVASRAESNIADLGRRLSNTPDVAEQFQAFNHILSALNADVEFDGDTGEITINRGLSKNPLTISIYGSGTDGIAGKITGELVDRLYQLLSERIATGELIGNLVYDGENAAEAFSRDLEALYSKVPQRNKETGEYYLVKAKQVKNQRSSQEFLPQNFTFSPEEYQAIKDNVRLFLVDELRNAMDQTVMGEVTGTTGLIQEATQLQSIFLRGLFHDQIIARLAEKQHDPDYHRGDFLSQSELDEIYQSLMPFAPVIETGTQSYMMSGAESADLFDKVELEIDGEKITVNMPESFARSLTSDLSSPAYVFGPTLAGVRAVPSLVIGSGDGQMMLNVLASNEALAARTLPVFDGLNMPADEIDGFSESINQAVYDSWTVNPLRAVADSFSAFLRNDPTGKVFSGLGSQRDDILLEISKVVSGSRKPKEIVTPEEAIAYMQAHAEKLARAADDIDIRQQVLKEIPLSIDQMASAESPYIREGEITIPAEAGNDEIATLLTDRYRKFKENQKKETDNKVSIEKDNQSLISVINELSRQDPSGAKVLAPEHLRQVIKGETPVQREMLRHMLPLLDPEYRIVFGTQDELNAWEQVYNIDRFIPGSNNGYGKIDPVSKIILISNISTETILHELVHATTLDKVRSFYDRPESLARADRDAIARLEGLMQEWLLQRYDSENETVMEAHRQATATIAGHLNNGRPAEALNEFMAWVLANQNLAEIAQKTKVRNRLFRIVGDALKALKNLLWGGENRGPRVGDSLLSNLRFNTRVLLKTPTTTEMLKQDGNFVALYQSASFGSNERLSQIRAGFNRKIIAAIENDTSETPARSTRQARADDAILAASELVDAFSLHFDSLANMQARTTFQAIQAALMVDTELNANALSRIEDLYAHVIRELKPGDFLKNPGQNDPADEYQANAKFNALSGAFLTREDRHGRSSLLSSFLALAMVDDQFRSILARMDKPKSARNETGTLDAKLENLATSGLDRLSRLMSGEKPDDRTVRQALDSLTMTLIESTNDQRTYIERQADKGLDGVDNYLAGQIQNLSEKLGDKADQVLADQDSSRLDRVFGRISGLTASLINEKRSEEAALGIVKWFNERGRWQTGMELVNEVTGRNRENAPVFDLISKVRSFIQQTRQRYRNDLPRELAKKFSRKLEAIEWTAMFKALAKTDLAALYATKGLQGTLELVADQQRLGVEIQQLESALSSLDPRRFAVIQKKARQLAHYMNSGEHGEKLLRNAAAIAHLFGERGFSMARVEPSLISQIDQLVTLYALQGIDQDTRTQMQDLLREQKDGVEFVLAFLNGLKNTENAKVNGDIARFNHYKGYVPSQGREEASLIVASDSEHTRLIRRGYTRIAVYSGSSADRSMGKRSYYYAPNSGRAVFNQGVMQTVHQTVSGIDPATGYTIDETTAGKIDDPQLIKLIERQINNQSQTRENLLPIYDGSGNVIAYERGVDVLQTAVLDKSTDLAQMIGIWQGRQVEELLAQEFNKDLVDRLHAIWTDQRKFGRKGEFVNLARLKKEDDPVLHEAWKLVPDQTRAYIAETFGPNEFWVSRGMLNDALGFRQASVGDVFTGNSRWNPKTVEMLEKTAIAVFKKDAYRYLTLAEQTVQDFVSDAKVRIVIQSVIVPAANLMSNMLQLLNRGVPLRHVIKGVSAKADELNRYIQRRDREIALDVDLRAARGRNDTVQIRKLENELRSIQDSYKRLSIWPLIEAGEFSAISDGAVTVEDLELSKNRWTGWVEGIAEKLPEPFKTPYRYGLITRDTALFKGLSRAVQYGDFLGKAILYEDLTRRQKKSQKEALATVNEAFINYNRLAGRTRNYLESIGLIWFWNFKLRSMKEALWTIRNRPLRSLMMLGVPQVPGMGTIGSPVTDNFAATLFDDRLGYSIGPGMAWNSFGLNPWINAMR